MFVRLDTHLKYSAICKSVASSDPSSPFGPSPPPCSSDPCILDIPMPTKSETWPSLKLPSSNKDMAEADLHFYEHLIPAVMNEASADANNSVLCESIYQYLSEKYGVRWSNPDKVERKSLETPTRKSESAATNISSYIPYNYWMMVQPSPTLERK